MLTVTRHASFRTRSTTRDTAVPGASWPSTAPHLECQTGVEVVEVEVCVEVEVDRGRVSKSIEAGSHESGQAAHRSASLHRGPTRHREVTWSRNNGGALMGDA